MIADAAAGPYSDIGGATANTYVLTGDDLGKYIKVEVTGTGSYTGTKESAAVGSVAVPPAYASTNALTNATVTVANGTSEADAKAALDATVGVVGTNSETGDATIAWTIASYNGSTAGDYTATVSNTHQTLTTKA